jgi:Glyoxalase-like domain
VTVPLEPEEAMAAFIKNLTVDCVDALRVARFWAAALGSDVDEDSTPERAYVEAAAWGGPNIWFRGGRGRKVADNRLHLDLRPLTGMDEEVGRLVGLGATVVERFDDITVMRDPEGNEFCVEPGPDDPHPASGR